MAGLLTSARTDQRRIGNCAVSKPAGGALSIEATDIGPASPLAASVGRTVYAPAWKT